jgi:hypothetical protein
MASEYGSDDPIWAVADHLANWCPSCGTGSAPCPVEDNGYVRSCLCCGLSSKHYLALDGHCYPCHARIAFWCRCSNLFYSGAPT